MNYTLNLRFLVKFLVVTGLVLGAVHFWHRRQAGQQVDLFYHLAETAKAEARPSDEVRYLRRYLALRPSDVDARERFGRILYEQSRAPQQAFEAFLVLEEALRRDPERDTLRRYVVDVALDSRLRLIAEARGHLEVLLAKDPRDGDLEGLMGLCKEIDGDLVSAEGHYWKSIQLKSDRIESYVRRAAILRRVTDPAVAKGIVESEVGQSDRQKRTVKQPLSDEANLTIAELVKKNADNYRAHLAAATYWRVFRHADRAAAEQSIAAAIAEAERLAPDEADVILAAGNFDRDRARGYFSHSMPKPDEAKKSREVARKQFTRGLELYPSSFAMYQALAGLEADEGRLDQAEIVLQSGTAALPESPDLWVALVDIKVLRKDATGAERALTRLRELKAASPIADYLGARIDVLREKWLEAATTLNRVRDELAGTPYAKPANILLARCYEQVGELDRRIEAFNRVVADKDLNDPSWVQAMIGLAEARAALGQTDAALDLYQTLTARVPAAWLAVARIRLDLATRQTSKPDLAPVELALERARQVLPPDTTGLVLLEADILNRQSKTEEARKSLTDLREKKAGEVDVWLALAAQDRWEGRDLPDGGRTRAAATLQEAQSRLGDSVSLRLARARLTVDPRAADAAAQLRALVSAESDSMSRADRVRLVRGLAEIAAGIGATELKADLLAQAATVSPHDLGIHLRRFDQALSNDNFAEVERVMADIRAVDGVDGTTHRAARAFYLIRRAQKDRQELNGLDEAARLLEAVGNVRPGWARVALGQAILSDLRGNPDRALGWYQKAVEQGEVDPLIIRRAVELLYGQGRFGEAQAYLKRLPTAVLETPDISRLAAEVSLRSRDPAQALAHAARAVKADSTNYRDQLWLAQMQWAANRAAGLWEGPLRKAVAGAKGDPAPLVVLVEFLVASDRRPDAEKAIAESADSIRPDQRAYARARCLHVVGKVNEAKENYRLAQEERPNDVRILRGTAEFHMQVGDVDAAEELWKRMGGLSEATEADRKHAVTMIAVCRAMNPRQDYKKTREALAAVGLLEGGNLKSPSDDMRPTDLRSAASVLALQLDRASKAEAIRYLEKLETVLRSVGQNPTAADRFLQAQLHAALNDFNAARDQLLRALADDPTNPAYTAYYVGYLIRQRRPELLGEAGRWLAAHAKLEPEAYRTAELRARLAAARKPRDEAEARKALQPWEKTTAVPIERLAAVYEEIGLFDDAGRLFQLSAERSKRPEGLLTYATFLGRLKKTREALERCEEARRQNCSPVALAHAGVAILYVTRHPDPAHVTQVAGWISEALPKAAADPAVAAALMNRQASILNVQEKYDEVIEIYKRALKLNPRDALAMNNLAYLFATHKRDFDGAFTWLSTAKSVIGPLPDLLDTEAMIHLARAKAEGSALARQKSLDAAIALLEDVVVQAPNATAYFHLAQAWLAAGQPAKAQLAWTEAKLRDLSVVGLHPLERAEYEALQAKLGG